MKKLLVRLLVLVVLPFGLITLPALVSKASPVRLFSGSTLNASNNWNSTNVLTITLPMRDCSQVQFVLIVSNNAPNSSNTVAKIYSQDDGSGLYTNAIGSMSIVNAGTLAVYCTSNFTANAADTLLVIISNTITNGTANLTNFPTLIGNTKPGL
jgi:hypothetical protein